MGMSVNDGGIGCYVDGDQQVQTSTWPNASLRYHVGFQAML
jgi:hypothetical protein